MRNLVREGHTHQLRNVMHSSRADGMLTLEASLNDLVADDLITYEDAVVRSMHPKEIRRVVPSLPKTSAPAVSSVI